MHQRRPIILPRHDTAMRRNKNGSLLACTVHRLSTARAHDHGTSGRATSSTPRRAHKTTITRRAFGQRLVEKSWVAARFDTPVPPSVMTRQQRRHAEQQAR